MTTETDKTERERFEAWARTAHPEWLRPLLRAIGDNSKYADGMPQQAWSAWQARAAFDMGAGPPGWKLVPAEPTPGMVAEGRECASAAVYRRMVAAAPQPPASTSAGKVAPVECIACEDHPQVPNDPCAVCGKSSAALDTDAVLDKDTIVAILRKHIYVDATGLAPAVVSHYIDGFEEAADAILSTAPQPPAPAGASTDERHILADDTPTDPEAEAPVDRAPLTFVYRNWRGETATRRVWPQRVYFGSTGWYPEPQWLMRAIDVDKGGVWDFAMQGMGVAHPDARQAAEDMREACAATVRAWINRPTGCEQLISMDPETGAYECGLEIRGRDCICEARAEGADEIEGLIRELPLPGDKVEG